MSDVPEAPDERLDTGEPIRVVRRPDGRFQATADIAGRFGPVAHHAVDATPEAARLRLRYHVGVVGAGPGGVAPPPTSGDRGRSMPMAVCEIKGQGRVMQCRSPGMGEWPAHVLHPPAVEPFCTACADHATDAEELARRKARWERHFGAAEGKAGGVPEEEAPSG